MEITFKYNDYMISKCDYLEITLETLKPALAYITKYKFAPNFDHFFESEIK